MASPPSLSLAQYFDDTRVEALIAVYDEKGSLDDRDTRASGGGRGAAAAGAVTESLAAAADTVKGAMQEAAGEWVQGRPWV